MSLTVLSVAYPLAPVGPDAVGGAEQVLTALDYALVAAGHRSIVVASEESVTAGELIATPRFDPPLNEAKKLAARKTHAEAIRYVLAQNSVDLVHMHALDFDAFLPPDPMRVLATLHLPLSCYSKKALYPERPFTWLHCVSRMQHQAAPPGMALLDPIPNGVDLQHFGGYRKRGFALFLGRICPEKGIHLAIEAANQAGIPLIIAGQVFGYEAHQAYFDREIRPRLGRSVRFVGPLGRKAKKRALAMARCLLVPSLIDETSSLVAREAAASGTPVIAFRKGAMAETIRDGETGFLVDGVTAMADAIGKCAEIESKACRAVAEQEFSLAVMVARYFAAYEHILHLARP